MATKSIRPTTRESSAYVRERGMRPLVVTITGSVLLIRPKGLRKEEVVSIEACWAMGVKQRVWRERQERKAARKAGKV